MSYLAGHPPRQEKSFWPPALQVVTAVSLIIGGRWADVSAQAARATDVWFFNALSVCLYIFGILFLPFALATLYRVARNRHRGIELIRR